MDLEKLVGRCPVCERKLAGCDVYPAQGAAWEVIGPTVALVPSSIVSQGFVCCTVCGFTYTFAWDKLMLALKAKEG